MSITAGSAPSAADRDTAGGTAIADALRHYILTDLAAVPLRRLDLDTPLFETLLDSTSVLALVSYIEDGYGIEVNDSEVVPDNFSSLRRLITYIARKRERASAPLAATGF